MTKVHVKTGDNVLVLNGKDRGKTGKVIEVNPKEGTVLVEGVNMATKHVKPKSMNQQGGIIHQEAPLNASKVMVVCPKCKKPSRMSKKILDDGNKVRVCKKCEEVIDINK